MTGEDIATALDTFLESSEWRGGDTAMTGEAIEAVLDAFYMGTGWRTVLSPSEIVSAINSELGSSEWQTPVDFPSVSNVINSQLGNAWMMRAVERTPRENIYLRPVDGSYNDLNYVSGTEANMGYLTWHNGGIIDGITIVDMTETDFIVPTSTWAFPTSVNLITASHVADSTFFEKIVEALNANPHWSKLPLFRTLDCSAVSSCTGYFTTEIQGYIDNLMAQSWVIYTPVNNLPQSPWVQVPSGIANAVDISGTGVLYVVRGDNGTTLEGEGLYVCETGSLDPVDWLQVTSISAWPARSSHVSTPSYTVFSATFASENFYAYKP